MFQRRRALTQVQAVVIVAIVILAGLGAYFLGLIPGLSSPFNKGSSTTIPHSTTPLPSTIQSGKTITTSLMFQGLNRTVIIHISKIYDPQKLQPLIIFLHGFSELAAQYSTGGFIDKVDQFGGIAVYPQGYYIGSWSQAAWYCSYDPTSWNTKNINDGALILEIIYRLKQQYNIDSNRVYVAGHSNGAYLAEDLIALYPDVFASVALNGWTYGFRDNATAAWQMVPKPKQPFSVIYISGTDENYYYGVDTAKSVAEATNWLVDMDGCSKTPQNTTVSWGMRQIVVGRYTGGKLGTEVVKINYIGGSHAWEVKSYDFAWDFYMSHPKLL